MAPRQLDFKVNVIGAGFTQGEGGKAILALAPSPGGRIVLSYG